MGLWDRQRSWKEIDDEANRHRYKPNRVLPQIRNLKVAPSNNQRLFLRIKSYLKQLLRL